MSVAEMLRATAATGKHRLLSLSLSLHTETHTHTHTIHSPRGDVGIGERGHVCGVGQAAEPELRHCGQLWLFLPPAGLKNWENINTHTQANKYEQSWAKKQTQKWSCERGNRENVEIPQLRMTQTKCRSSICIIRRARILLKLMSTGTIVSPRHRVCKVWALMALWWSVELKKAVMPVLNNIISC